MIEFLIENWSLILALIVGIINLILLIFKKKVVIKDTIFEQLLVRLPVMIRNVEQTGKCGSDKKTAVVAFCVSWLSEMTGMTTKEVYDKYLSKIDTAIESILATPQKKEVNICEEE